MYTKQNTVSLPSFCYSQSNSIVNVFGDSTESGPGILQVVKKVVESKTMAMKYSKAMSLDLHKNVDVTFVIPIRYYDGRVYVLDDVVRANVQTAPGHGHFLEI